MIKLPVLSWRVLAVVVLAAAVTSTIYLVLSGAFATAANSTAATPVVDVFPIPGGQVATPGTQLTFRGIPAASIGTVTVTGSKSGVHTGKIEGDSDGDGGSFIPSHPFTAGETVKVSTSLDIAGASNGSYSFKIATPANRIPNAGLPKVPRVKGDVWRFNSARGLIPASIRVTTQPHSIAPGDIFLAPQVGPVQSGPMILGPYGGLIWFKPLPKGQSATDFRVQTYNGQPVLTWWQGHVTAAGVGMGQDEIYDTSYKHVKTVKAGNGLQSDLHEFELTPQGTALVTAYFPVIWNSTAAPGGIKKQIVLDSVAQEIDMRTGLVLWQWDSLDHVPVTDSYQHTPTVKGHPWDYFHINSVQQAPDGSVLISSRDMWAVYDVSHQTDAFIWQLNGKHSTFKLKPGAHFAFQHDVRIDSTGKLMTIFDDGAGPPKIESQSRAITLRLDTKHWTATLVNQDRLNPPELAYYEGSDQALANGDDFVGWGQQPYFSEFNSHGKMLFNARFIGVNESYRTFKYPWSATPANQVGVGVQTSGGKTTVYASWNGATAIASWRILGGSSPTSLQTVATHRKTAFETAVPIPHQEAYVATQALDADGNVLGTSKPIKGS
jgi:Arylsulfotransferase (ASST)